MCEKCQDRGFTEKEHGLLNVLCDCGKAREVAERNGIPWRETVLTVESPQSEVTFTGLLIQLAGKRTDEYSEDELWGMAKKEAVTRMEFPYILIMPCGRTVRYDDPSYILCLPNRDIQCSCGNPNHYVVKFSDVREVLDVEGMRSAIENYEERHGLVKEKKPTKPRKRKKKAHYEK